MQPLALRQGAEDQSFGPAHGIRPESPVRASHDSGVTAEVYLKVHKIQDTAFSLIFLGKPASRKRANRGAFIRARSDVSMPAGGLG